MADMHEIAARYGMTPIGGPGAERKPNQEKVIWRWIPEKKKYDENDPHRHDDIAEEYAIEMEEKADAGLIVLGKYRGRWLANPSGRPVIAKLLADSGVKIELPKRRDDW